MPVITPAPRACILLREDHPPIEFASREAAFDFVRPALRAGCFGTAFAQAEYRTNWFGTSVSRQAITHVLIDIATWTPLQPSAFDAWLPPRMPWTVRRYAGWSGTGPVPGTGRRHHHRGLHYRRMRTQRSLRLSVPLDDSEVAGRPRSWKNLPSAWDDYNRGDLGQCNWKRHRRTQWRSTIFPTQGRWSGDSPASICLVGGQPFTD